MHQIGGFRGQAENLEASTSERQVSKGEVLGRPAGSPTNGRTSQVSHCLSSHSNLHSSRLYPNSIDVALDSHQSLILIVLIQ